MNNFQINYSYKEQDIIFLSKRGFKHGIGRMAGYEMILFAFFTILMIFTGSRHALIFSLGYFVLIIITDVIVYFRYINHAKTRYRTDQSMPKPHQLVINDECLTFINGENYRKMKYSDIKKIKIESNYLIIYLNNRHLVSIPLREYTDRAEEIVSYFYQRRKND